jgi:alkanesulfonate monooxygenase SsuD/methylene tetrahydromethanopterin reductase-like flavin-dependent oxidoreductase (luciferase family)
MLSVGMLAITPDATPSSSTRAIAAAGLDHVVCGDHVSFIVGAGFDGLIGATHELATESSLRAFVAVYLLPLRHPVPVARQLSSISERYPGRTRRRWLDRHLELCTAVRGSDRHHR